MSHTSEHIAAGEGPHQHTADAGHGAATHTDADWTGFRADDYNAGRAVVVLVLSIFCMGVGIYSIVAYTVINWN
ncbi:MAG: hypothetical protein EXS16_17780 [Gemmataceae bacterium]|nr:hypothetical protein [Gemmataceae bacterium]